MTRKTVSVLALGTVVACALALLVGLFVLVPSMSTGSAYAFDADNDAPVSDVPTLLVNGSEHSELLCVPRGDSITVEVLYQGKRYVPALTADGKEFAFCVNNNVLTVGERSRLGELSIAVECDLPDEIVYRDTLRVVVTYGETIVKPTTYEDRTLTLTLPEDILFVYATLSAQDYRGFVNVMMKNGEEVNGYAEFAPHKTSGLIVTYDGFCLAVENAEGDSSVQIVSNGTFGLYVDPTQTRSLTGSGTSSNPYKIYSQSDFLEIANYDSSNSTVWFKQQQNFTVTGTYSQPDFFGDYNGNSKTLTVNNVTNVNSAMFNENNGVIRNLTISVLKFVGGGFWSIQGIVCKTNSGEITNVKVNGQYSASVTAFTGIILGNYLFSTYESANFNAALMCGGISGTNGGTISNCSVNMYINAGYVCGGISGANSGTISGCSVKSTFYISLTDTYFRGGVVGQNDTTGQINSAVINAALFVAANPGGSSTYTPTLGFYVGRNYNSSLNTNVSTPNYITYLGCFGGGVLSNNVNTSHTNITYVDGNGNHTVYGNGTGIGW